MKPIIAYQGTQPEGVRMGRLSAGDTFRSVAPSSRAAPTLYMLAYDHSRLHSTRSMYHVVSLKSGNIYPFESEKLVIPVRTEISFRDTE